MNDMVSDKQFTAGDRTTLALYAAIAVLMSLNGDDVTGVPTTNVRPQNVLPHLAADALILI